MRMIYLTRAFKRASLMRVEMIEVDHDYYRNSYGFSSGQLMDSQTMISHFKQVISTASHWEPNLLHKRLAGAQA